VYLCVETGVIHYPSEFDDEEEESLPEDISDSEKYIPVPHKNDLGLGKRVALRFADDLLPDASDEIHDIFRHRGAYGRFKNLLEHRGLLQQWYGYEEEARNKALREWCEVSEIELLD